MQNEKRLTISALDFLLYTRRSCMHKAIPTFLSHLPLLELFSASNDQMPSYSAENACRNTAASPFGISLPSFLTRKKWISRTDALQLLTLVTTQTGSRSACCRQTKRIPLKPFPSQNISSKRLLEFTDFVDTLQLFLQNVHEWFHRKRSELHPPETGEGSSWWITNSGA